MALSGGVKLVEPGKSDETSLAGSSAAAAVPILTSMNRTTPPAAVPWVAASAGADLAQLQSYIQPSHTTGPSNPGRASIAPDTDKKAFARTEGRSRLSRL